MSNEKAWIISKAQVKLFIFHGNYLSKKTVRIEKEKFFVVLEDDREIGVPYSWFPLLANATPEQRQNWRFIGKGTGIHWEDIDEDISIKALLYPQ